MKRPTRISPFHIGLRRPTPGTQAGSPKPTSPRATPTASSGPWCRCTARTWRSSSTAWPASPPTRHPRRTRRASATSTSRAPRRRDLVTRLQRHLRWLPRRHLPPHGRGGAPGHDRVPPPPERPRRRAQGHRADGRLRLRRGPETQIYQERQRIGVRYRGRVWTTPTGFPSTTSELVPTSTTTRAAAQPPGAYVASAPTTTRGLVLPEYIDGLPVIGAFQSEPAGSDTTQLSSIAAKGVKQLQYLHVIVMESQLASIEISELSALTTIEIRNCPIKAIDLTGCSNVFTLIIENTLVSKLDLSSCAHLYTLSCTNSKLTSLDISPRS